MDDDPADFSGADPADYSTPRCAELGWDMLQVGPGLAAIGRDSRNHLFIYQSE